MLKNFLEKQRKQRGRTVAFLVVSAVLLALAAYAVALEIFASYRSAGLVGIGVFILSLIVWNIIYGRFLGL